MDGSCNPRGSFLFLSPVGIRNKESFALCFPLEAFWRSLTTKWKSNRGKVFVLAFWFSISLYRRPRARNQRLLIRFSCTRHPHGMSTRLCVDFGLILLFLPVIADETKAQNEEAYHKGLIFFSHFSLCGPLRLSAAAERCLKGRQFVVDWLYSLGCAEKKWHNAFGDSCWESAFTLSKRIKYTVVFESCRGEAFFHWKYSWQKPQTCFFEAFPQVKTFSITFCIATTAPDWGRKETEKMSPMAPSNEDRHPFLLYLHSSALSKLSAILFLIQKSLF